MLVKHYMLFSYKFMITAEIHFYTKYYNNDNYYIIIQMQC